MFQELGTVVAKSSLGATQCVVEVETRRSGRGARAGQFAMLLAASGSDPFLPRPFSYYDVTEEGERVLQRFLVQRRGLGSLQLSELRQGDRLQVLGPLGRGFDLSKTGPRQLFLVAGGVGIAPFLFLMKCMEVAAWKKAGTPLRLLAGGRGAAQLEALKDFEGLGAELDVSTEDGSLGRRGLITETLERRLSASGKDALVLACGPWAMLKKVAELADAAGVPCQASLEVPMACGVGLCLGCAVTRASGEGYLLGCTHGPVVDAKAVHWG